MKMPLLFVIIFTFYAFFPTFKNKQILYAQSTYWAQITQDDTYIYSSTASEFKIFILPKTYFVELLSSEGEYYYVRYNDIYGYVNKNEVSPVVGTPQCPFLTNITFRVFVPSGANLRSSPNNSGPDNLVFSIPFLDNNLSYYGITSGEEAISKKGNVWYYCKYFNSNITYQGYVYSPLCDLLTSIPLNNEQLEFYVDQIKFENEATETSTISMDGLSSTAQTLIIIAISLPCLFFIYILIKPTMIAESKSESKTRKKYTHSKKKISKLKNSDYFEFDDDP